MYFSKLAGLALLALASTTLAAPAPIEEVEARGEALEARGFGCPLNRQQCNDHVSRQFFRDSVERKLTFLGYSAFPLVEDEPEGTVPELCVCKELFSS